MLINNKGISSIKIGLSQFDLERSKICTKSIDQSIETLNKYIQYINKYIQYILARGPPYVGHTPHPKFQLHHHQSHMVKEDSKKYHNFIAFFKLFL